MTEVTITLTQESQVELIEREIKQLRTQLEAAQAESRRGWGRATSLESQLAIVVGQREESQDQLAAAQTDAEAWRITCKGKEGAYVKMEQELAYLKLQRDALLKITWLDLPDDPDESTAKWQELFNKGWVRRDQLAAAQAALQRIGRECSVPSPSLEAKHALAQIHI